MEKNSRISSNFIHNMIDEDYKNSVYTKRLNTRFPPEPNGYLHIGHAKAIFINFETAKRYDGLCNLRFDDTNPIKEDVEYVNSIMEDIKWLGYEWDNLHYASDYFDKMYEYAVMLIKKGKAYVCDLSPEEIKEYKGNFTTPGKDSPYRNRSVEENLDLFERMKNGEFKDGEKVLRAKIDMKANNINMRDPVIYRIAHVSHHRTGDKWCIYPMYDYAHPIEDAIEGITHSLCSLEFEDHRPLYNWFINEIGIWNEPPRQIEFAKLSISDALIGKRSIRKLVEEGKLDGWNDPRLYTLSGLRRRGYTKDAILDFINSVGISKSNSTVDVSMLEHSIRNDLKMKCERRMVVLNPLKLVITNYEEGKIEYVEAKNNPENEELGVRKIPFGREIYIEKEDFMENPPKKYFRLFPGNEVRLRNAYFVKCNEVIKDEEGNVIEIRCTYDAETKSGSGFTARKVKGTIHWVEATHAENAEVRIFDHLLKDGELNEDTIKILDNVKMEPELKNSEIGDKFQFLRHGYFCVDSKYTTKDKKVFNQIVSLKDSFKKKK